MLPGRSHLFELKISLTVVRFWHFSGQEVNFVQNFTFDSELRRHACLRFVCVCRHVCDFSVLRCLCLRLCLRQKNIECLCLRLCLRRKKNECLCLRLCLRWKKIKCRVVKLTRNQIVIVTKLRNSQSRKIALIVNFHSKKEITDQNCQNFSWIFEKFI